MTELNNTNADDERTNPASDDGASRPAQGHGEDAGHADAPEGNTGKPDLGNLDAAWAAFQAEHRDDLNDVASSRNAKRFERHAERKEKERLLSVDDLRPDAFSSTGASHGPRDFTGSSWLDTDDVMDAHDDGDFTPPNPDLGDLRTSTVMLAALMIIGLAGMLAMILVPALYGIPVLSTILNLVFGLCTIVGLAGLVGKILNRKDRPGDRGGYFDDGARV
ncbi:hypothetical protein [Bifidobacterium aesculapii]|uniref:hypothetical protein n=1 Tax=Bifidobacterium aesculapii TaxID=1329411 RepID=UPI0006E3C6EE|nr:hypothetical protein [Bifidobacterium aesculapii]